MKVYVVMYDPGKYEPGAEVISIHQNEAKANEVCKAMNDNATWKDFYVEEHELKD